MKQKLINWFMVIEPVLSIIIYITLTFTLYKYGFFVRIFDRIVPMMPSYIYMRVLKKLILLILIIALVKTLIKKKEPKVRYLIYAMVCIFQLGRSMFFQYALGSYVAYDTSIGTVACSTNFENKHYYIYEDFDVIHICKREIVESSTIPSNKITINNEIIEYAYYDGKNCYLFCYEFEMQLTEEEKMIYLNVFINDIDALEENNMLREE